MPAVDAARRGYRIRWAGLLAVAGQEVAWVTGDGRWRAPQRELPEFQRLLRLRPHLAKWHGWWLLLSQPEVLGWALGRYREAGRRRLDLALRDAGWILHSLSWAYYADQATLALLDWLDAVHPSDALHRLETLPRFPGNDRGRLDKSARLLQAAIQAAALGLRTLLWGGVRFDLGPLLPHPEP